MLSHDKVNVIEFLLFITDLGEDVFVQLGEPRREDYVTNCYDNDVDLNVRPGFANYYVSYSIS